MIGCKARHIKTFLFGPGLEQDISCRACCENCDVPIQPPPSQVIPGQSLGMSCPAPFGHETELSHDSGPDKTPVPCGRFLAPRRLSRATHSRCSSTMWTRALWASRPQVFLVGPRLVGSVRKQLTTLRQRPAWKWTKTHLYLDPPRGEHCFFSPGARRHRRRFHDCCGEMRGV